MTDHDRRASSGDDFSDRVMAAIALVAAPSPTRSFLAAIRAGSGSDAMAALAVAWHLGTTRGWPVASPVRARSFALVLAVASILATGSMVAASAARSIIPHVERSPIFEQRGSVILDAGPAIIHEPASARRHPKFEAVPVAVISVPLVEPKDAPLAPAGDDASDDAPQTGHGDSDGIHDREPAKGNDDHAMEDDDKPSSDDDADHDPEDPEASDDHDDGAEDEADSDEADSEDGDHHGDGERDGGDDHESDDHGEESGD